MAVLVEDRGVLPLVPNALSSSDFYCPGLEGLNKESAEPVVSGVEGAVPGNPHIDGGDRGDPGVIRELAAAQQRVPHVECTGLAGVGGRVEVLRWCRAQRPKRDP